LERIMADKTILVVPGRKMSVARPLKRAIQIAGALALTSLIAFIAVYISTAYTPRGGAQQSLVQWLLIVKRPDIQATAILTAIVSVLFVYWQRDKEKQR
jgi:ABC-type Mn2+/Zn2+ transport system permease subunit